MTFWMLLRQGTVQGYDTTFQGRPESVWPLATSHDLAMKFAQWIGRPDMRPALIGSVEGETLEGHLALILQRGCRLIYLVCGVQPDGAPVVNVIDAIRLTEML